MLDTKPLSAEDIAICRKHKRSADRRWLATLDQRDRELAKARAALELASNDERLQSSGQDDYVLCQVRAALAPVVPNQSAP